MKTVLLVALLVLCSLGASWADDMGVGSGSPAVITLPKAFRHENESATTLFVMPRKDDDNGPISLRLTCLRDMTEDKLSEDRVKELLAKLNPKSEYLHFGNNLATTQAEEGMDDTGAKWRFTHYVVYADQLLITVTVQMLQGREKEPQCHELLEVMPQILASLGRKKP